MAEPILFATAAQHLRLGADESEKALVESYIEAAREWVENYTGHVLVRRAITESLASFGSYIRLTRRPIVSVDEAGYTDADGVEQTISAFSVMAGVYPVRVYPAYDASWPSVRTNTPITITYTAGYASGEEPQALLQAMLLLIGHWFSTRATVNIGSSVTEVPLAATSLCDQYRVPVV